MNVTLVDDDITENMEEFQATLAAVTVTTSAFVSPSIAKVIIEDNDSKISLQSVYMPHVISSGFLLTICPKIHQNRIQFYVCYDEPLKHFLC